MPHKTTPTEAFVLSLIGVSVLLMVFTLVYWIYKFLMFVYTKFIV